MVRIDCLVFGYRKITVPPELLARASSILLREEIPTRMGSHGTFILRERDIHKMRSVFSGKIEYTESDVLGLYGAYHRLRHKALILVASILMLFLSVIASSVVWDVRIVGNERIPDSRIIYELEECGLSVGNFWRQIDRSLVESKFLSDSDDIAWINVNRRGTVAYVTVAEMELGNMSDNAIEPMGYSNIVATESCVIEEITVRCGTAAVKVGDVVRAGDILIAGIRPDESGGGFCYADGTVVGRISDTVEVSVGRNYEKKVEMREEISSVSIKFFNFYANIFKKYGNTADSCDIIEDIKTFSLPGNAKLPIEIITRYSTEYETESLEYSDAELVRVCSYRLNSTLASRLATSDLIKMKSSGGYTDTGYYMRSDIVYLSSVGKPQPFSAE